jgi:hypothetical protein
VKEIVESKPKHKFLLIKYINKSKPIKIKCEIANEEAYVDLASYMKSKGCNACYLKQMRETQKQKNQKKLEQIRVTMA